jgi:cytochrome c oxidase accessory protein FixG
MISQAKPGSNETYRDSISTISTEGKRAWIYPKKPLGRFYNARTIVAWVLLALLFSGPFMRYDGRPLMLFNILERKFIVFGVAFWPQDFFLFVLAMLTFIVFIILFTVVFGRIWCGWACPQTIFMEMIFRKIEYLIEGDWNQQKQLDNASWDTVKIRKKLLKHVIFFILSFIIANTFLAYIIGTDELSLLVKEGPGKHMGGFVALVLFTGVFYGVYARFREQACIVVCPYGRLQGVLLDRNSTVIGYDYLRGEPRGKINKEEKRVTGDCIDCKKCVHVCPTGIDIRNGTQLECINCTACIDACDEVMDKVGFPKGLIRYTSENNIINKTKFRWTTRIISYCVVFIILITTLVTLIATRSDIETTVMRTRGQLYQLAENNQVSNLYNIQLVNKTFKDIPVTLHVKDYNGAIKFAGNPLKTLEAEKLTEATFFVLIDKAKVQRLKTRITIEILSGDKVIDEVKTNFLGPTN